MLEKMKRENNEVLTGPDQIYFYTPTDTTEMYMTTQYKTWRIANAFAFTLHLPPVEEAKGLTFTISVTTATAAVTLLDSGTSTIHQSINWEGSTGYVLDAAEDSISLTSDGRTWYVNDNEIA